MPKYNFYFTNAGYLIPNDIVGKPSTVELTSSNKPIIKKSINETIHEVTDDCLFYTSVLGKYNVITYEFNNIQVVKYRLEYACKYNICVKSSKSELTYKISGVAYPVVSVSLRDSIILHDFDIEEFVNFNFLMIKFEPAAELVLYSAVDGRLYAKIHSMVLDLGKTEFKGFAIGKLTDKLYTTKVIAGITLIEPKDNFDSFDNNAGILMYDDANVMIWYPYKLAHAYAYSGENGLFCIDKFALVPVKSGRIEQTKHFDIVKVFIDKEGGVTAPNVLMPSTAISFRLLSFLSSGPNGDVNYLKKCGFDFMIRIHRSIIRKLYAKYVYINVLDIGIGKCRDVYYYSKYVSKNSIHGVEPNREFSRACNIKNIYNNTADGIFKYFKMNKHTEKFNTIIFCNSYNFVTDPYITMKESEEFLADSGRVVIVYMNNDKVESSKNKSYEIKKGDPNPDLPDSHVLKNKQNYIEVFSETTLVPSHYENQISESEIIDAVDRVNNDLKETKREPLEIIEKGTLVHRLSSWLDPDAKKFNSMFYYIIIGKPCIVDKVIIAFDLYTSTLKDYLDYLRGKNVYCNGISIEKYNGDIKMDNTSIKCIVVDNVSDYKKVIADLNGKPHNTIINIQKPNELECSMLYNADIKTFVEQRTKLIEMNIPHSKFGFGESKAKK
jgi:hypothetical protein